MSTQFIYNSHFEHVTVENMALNKPAWHEHPYHKDQWGADQLMVNIQIGLLKEGSVQYQPILCLQHNGGWI